jgi:hypothetical protein
VPAAGAADPGRVRPGRPSLAALVTITVPWATLQGRRETPGHADGFGMVDAGDARDLVAGAAAAYEHEAGLIKEKIAAAEQDLIILTEKKNEARAAAAAEAAFGGMIALGDALARPLENPVAKPPLPTRLSVPR